LHDRIANAENFFMPFTGIDANVVASGVHVDLVRMYLAAAAASRK